MGKKSNRTKINANFGLTQQFSLMLLLPGLHPLSPFKHKESSGTIAKTPERRKTLIFTTISNTQDKKNTFFCLYHSFRSFSDLPDKEHFPCVDTGDRDLKSRKNTLFLNILSIHKVKDW